MAVIAGMTFVLFLLFKWGCYKLIYGYMGFAMLNIFFFFTGALVLQLLRLIGLHMDLFSLAFLLFNFSVLGILSLFVMPVPLLLKQSYTVWVGICVAYIFTHIPEWTSWVLLVIMALYDLAAVLLPGGPLKILVELAIERQQELPALIYESRPTQRPYQRGMWRRQPPTGSSSSNAADGSSSAAAGSGSGLAHVAVAGGGGVLAGEIVSGSGGSPNVFVRVALLGDQQHRSSWDEAAASPQVSQELALAGSSSSGGGGSGNAAGGGGRFGSARRRGSGNGDRSGGGAVPLAEGREEQGEDVAVEQQQLLLLQQEQQRSDAAWHSRPAAAAAAAAGAAGDKGRGPLGEGVEDGPAAAAGASSSSSSRGGLLPASGSSSAAAGAALTPAPAAAAAAAVPDGRSTAAAAAAAADSGQPGSSSSDGGEGSEGELPDGIKLGLGDFIFYSMLVGRAAMYDMMTVFASYIAVISGLGITLMLLALYRKALPALPVSIALGVLFYFLTRLVMEPFVVPLSLNMAYY
uniref:Presenilin n=2 Tax=Tetradesmus obliquus TaxID=3088 RepID=A0A383VT88_TETOB|eukprot:jgi/Sobl393_1/16152/SZX68717.1